MSKSFVFEARLGVGKKMDASDSKQAWDELRELVRSSDHAHRKSRDFWDEMFGSEDALFYDAEGNDRTDLFRALIERLDLTTRLAESLSERVAVLERLAVQDEARIALEIEKLRKEG